MSDNKLDPQRIKWEEAEKSYAAILNAMSKSREEALSEIEQILRKAREQREGNLGQ
jgi:hypothetical protein